MTATRLERILEVVREANRICREGGTLEERNAHEACKDAALASLETVASEAV